MTKDFISSRLGLFNWSFAQFTSLQISKSMQSADMNPLLPILVASAAYIHFINPNNTKLSFIMYMSFLSISIMEGSLSNHVVVSCALVLLVISACEMTIRRSIFYFAAVLYLSTGVHKLNYDFFDPTHSCASLYVSGALSSLPEVIFQIHGLHQICVLLVNLAPYVAVTFELGMPILLLLFPSDKAQRIVILAGSFFHAILALPPSPLSVYPFSAIMVPIYILLVPESVDIEKPVNYLMSRLWVKAFMPLVLFLANKYAPSLLFQQATLFEYPNYRLWSCFFVWNCMWWSIIILQCLKGRSPKRSSSMFAQPNPLPAIIIVCLFLFAMSPYVGLRTYPALAMFSNLRVEGSNPNHWMPSYDLFGYMSDWAEITEAHHSTVRNMQVDLGQMFPEKLKSTNARFGISNEFYICPPRWNNTGDPKFKPIHVPFIELRRKVSGQNWTAGGSSSLIKYQRHHANGSITEEIFHSDLTDSRSELLKPLTFFERAFVRFRTFNEFSSSCRH